MMGIKKKILNPLDPLRVNQPQPKYEFHIRFIVICLAALTPLLLLITQGYQPSISTYWRTPMQPLFIISNALTSYYLYNIPKWRISSIFLLLLTAFSVDSYSMFHNILAIGFFVANVFPLYKSKRFKVCFYLYISSCVFIFFNIMVMEIISIVVLCLYHGLLLNRIKSLQSKMLKS